MRQAFTLVELVIVMAIIGILAAIAIPTAAAYVDKTRLTVAVAELRGLEKAITLYQNDRGRLPATLNDLGAGPVLDPWGNPYQFKPFSPVPVPPGQKRKDRFLVPVNTDYDLYSMGKDGRTAYPFTAAKSRDDIVRANDGGFMGLAADY